jgi:DNA-binding IclR family transcriptional regulator
MLNALRAFPLPKGAHAAEWQRASGVSKTVFYDTVKMLIDLGLVVKNQIDRETLYGLSV